MATYSEFELVQAAESLLKQANEIAWMLATKWGLICFAAGILGLGALQMVVQKTDIPIGIVAAIVAVLGTAAGFAEGRRRSFELRLDAQKLLVLVEIERHTRR